MAGRDQNTRSAARRSAKGGLRVGVDTGGTFTDLVALGGDGPEAGPRVGKVPSTPQDPSRAVAHGMELFEGERVHEVVHGTTVALNALLTGRTGKVALVTNRGFRDLIEIGRQERPDIYTLHPEKPPALVPRERRFEVDQRTWPDGQGGWEESASPTAEELAALARRVAGSRPESVAVCLLHAYADPEIETRVADALAGLGVPVTTSSSILRSFREYERFATSVANAALVPVVRDYLSRLEGRLPGRRLSIMQSSGGTLSAAQAAVEPVRVLFSGPAGGVIGAGRAALDAGFERIAALDIGGTSADVAFHAPREGMANTVLETRVAGGPIAVPTLDIHTIGCGGGSLVHVDAGGILHVGPESAGADPGPVCYGNGDRLTLTDAHVFLGHVASNGFLEGGLPLDVDAVARAFEVLGRKLGVAAEVAAQGVLDVAHASIRRAVGVMTMQRGHDPKRLPLVAFGGGGGLAAVSVASSLDMPGALVPAHPGVLSAFGMVAADAVHDETRTLLAPLAETGVKRRREVLRELGRRGKEMLVASGIPARSVDFEYSLDLRYVGQSFEISVPDGPDPRGDFEARHERLYGWKLPENEVEIVHARARASARAPLSQPGQESPRPRRRPAPARAHLGTRPAYFGEVLETDRFDRTQLAPGHGFEGPAIVEEYSGTTLVPPGYRAEVTRGGHLWVRPV